MNYMVTVIFYLTDIVVLSAACGQLSFYYVGEILHPKTDGVFLFSTEATREFCFSLCVAATECWTIYHNPNLNECVLASFQTSVAPDTSYPNTATNTFKIYRQNEGYTSCANLLQTYPDSTDGDYWLYPSVVTPNAVRLYCHQMSSGSPTEYVSFPVKNRGEYPNKTFQKCRNPQDYLSGCPGQNGIYEYSKVRIDITSMVVDRTDQTFVSGSGKFRDYAWAGDCYSELDNTYLCGPLGSFVINTLGTGLKVDPALTWITGGYKAKVIQIDSQGGAVIDLTCGGYPGNCVPNGNMIFHLNSADSVSRQSAMLKP